MSTADTLRALIGRIGISQRAAARLIGISERQMRSYLAAADTATAIDAPAYIGLALEGIIARLDAIDITDSLMDAVAAGERIAVYPHGHWLPLEPGQVPDDEPLYIVPASEPSDGWRAEDRDDMYAACRDAVIERLNLGA